jgi:hypothetical protein
MDTRQRVAGAKFHNIRSAKDRYWRITLPKSRHQLSHRQSQVLQRTGDAANSSGQMQIKKWAERRPTQAGTMSDRSIHVFNRSDPLLHQIESLLLKGRLKTIGDMTADITPDMNRPLAYLLIEGQRLLDRNLRGQTAADHFHQRDQMRRLNGCPSNTRSG